MKQNKLVRAIPGILILGLVVWGCVEIVVGVLAFFKGLDSDLATAFLAASGAVIASVASLAVSKVYETRAAIRKDLREKKTPVYEEIVRTMFEVMFAPILGKEPPSEDALKEFFAETTEKLTIWGSDEVLKEFGDFKTGGMAAQEDSSNIIFSFERLLLAIRKDLGHKNRGIGRGGILRLFVTDLDKHMGGSA